MRAKFYIFNRETFVESVVRDFRELRIGSLNLPGWLIVPPDDVARLHAFIDENMIFSSLCPGRTTVDGKTIAADKLYSGAKIGLGSVVKIVVEYPVVIEALNVEYIPPRKT